MSPETTLIQLRHPRDLLSVLRADGPWVRPADGAEGLPHAVLGHLVERRNTYPVHYSDRAFVTTGELARSFAQARGCDVVDVSAVLRQLQSERLVESCGSAVGEPRWRATEHAVHSLRSSRIAA